MPVEDSTIMEIVVEVRLKMKFKTMEFRLIKLKLKRASLKL